MTDYVLITKQISAKSFRRAKQWYLGYVLCQVIVLIFAVCSIFTEFNPNVSALIAFIVVLVAECIRWISDSWKSEGEIWKRKWEKISGFGIPVDNNSVTDWLAKKTRGFLADVAPQEIQGLEFDNDRPVGGSRTVHNIFESAWWSKHLCFKMVRYLAVLLVVVVILSFIALPIAMPSRPTRGGGYGSPSRSREAEFVERYQLRLDAEGVLLGATGRELYVALKRVTKDYNLSFAMNSVQQFSQRFRNDMNTIREAGFEIHVNELRRSYLAFDIRYRPVLQ